MTPLRRMALAPARTRPLLASRSVGAAWALGVGGLGILLLGSLYLRTRGLSGQFWMDEGLSVGISSHRLFDIPGLLHQDGSPPLYYMALHVWMSVFGEGEARTHVLSLLCALAAIPVGLWAGWSLWGPRAGWSVAVLAAVNPFLTSYGQETRMYALLALLSVAATAAFLHAFVYRRRGYLPAFAVLLALMLYTHNWGLFFAVGAAAAWLVELRDPVARPGVLRDGLLGFGAAGVLYVPWLPTLASQAAHTGAPWSNRPRFGVPIQIAKGLLGGAGPALALLLGGGLGLRGLVGREENPERRAAVALVVMAVVTLFVAWVLSQISPAWNVRYFGAVLGPLLLLAALGLSRAGAVGIAALACVAILSLRPMGYALNNKSNVRDAAAEIRGDLRPGDLLIAGQPEQLPLVRYYLPGPYRWATTMGPSRDPQIMDWRDAVDHLDAARPATALAPLLARVPVGGHVLLVRPVTFGTSNWKPRWTTLVRRRSAQWGAALVRDPRFRLVRIAPTFYKHASVVGDALLLFRRVS